MHNDRYVYQLALVLMPPALIDEVWQGAWVRVGSERQIQISDRLVMTRSDQGDNQSSERSFQPHTDRKCKPMHQAFVAD